MKTALYGTKFSRYFILINTGSDFFLFLWRFINLVGKYATFGLSYHHHIALVIFNTLFTTCIMDQKMPRSVRFSERGVELIQGFKLPVLI